MPRKQQSLKDSAVAFLRSESSGPRLAANLKLVRALAVFFGGVVVFRNFGEALFAWATPLTEAAFK
ncbi:hypothetical protein V8C86DRAFT_3090713 [Haematococcus lacustris]